MRRMMAVAAVVVMAVTVAVAARPVPSAKHVEAPGFVDGPTPLNEASVYAYLRAETWWSANGAFHQCPDRAEYAGLPMTAVAAARSVEGRIPAGLIAQVRDEFAPMRAQATDFNRAWWEFAAPRMVSLLGLTPARHMPMGQGARCDGSTTGCDDQVCSCQKYYVALEDCAAPASACEVSEPIGQAIPMMELYGY